MRCPDLDLGDECLLGRTHQKQTTSFKSTKPLQKSAIKVKFSFCHSKEIFKSFQKLFEISWRFFQKTDEPILKVHATAKSPL
jgi:hypothetical protein